MTQVPLCLFTGSGQGIIDRVAIRLLHTTYGLFIKSVFRSKSLAACQQGARLHASSGQRQECFLSVAANHS